MPLESAVFPPDLPAVVQCRLASGLLDYKTGKSAMVWYDAGPSTTALVIAAREHLSTRLPKQSLVIRFRPAHSPQTELRELLRRFFVRFGALPIAHQDV